MTTWLEANRLANLAAAQAHGDLGIDTAVPPVDVYGAIGDVGVVLMWRLLPRQFGAYVAEPGSRPGILINNGLPFAAQRQTAGHELGHHRLGHGTRVDADLDAAVRPAAWTPEEKAAEAFAAWFLMPRKAVLAALACLDLDRLRTPLDVYRLSLLLGTPYMMTVRHLPSLRLASQNLAATWARTPPGAIKGSLDRAAEKPPSRAADVWLISPGFAGLDLTMHAGDRIVIAGAGDDQVLVEAGWLRPASAARPRTQSARAGQWPEAAVEPDALVLEIPAEAVGKEAEVTVVAAASSAGAAVQWAFRIKVEEKRSGIARRWVS